LISSLHGPSLQYFTNKLLQVIKPEARAKKQLLHKKE